MMCLKNEFLPPGQLPKGPYRVLTLGAGMTLSRAVVVWAQFQDVGFPSYYISSKLVSRDLQVRHLASGTTNELVLS